MSAVTRPRGPLPSRVYWFRRTLVLLVLLVVVLGVVRLAGGDEDPGAANGDTAATMARARQSDTPAGSTASPSATPSATPSASEDDGSPASSPSTGTTSTEATTPTPTKRPLPQPDGPCAEADVLVTPRITGSRSDGSVDITLAFTTVESAACTFEVSPESVFVTVSSKERTLWASQHCGSVVPTEEVVPRRTKAAEVVLRWDGHESAVGCPAESPWVDSGEYTVAAMARGSVNVSKSTFTVTSADD